MKDLSPLARQLVQVGKKAHQPTEAEKVRILEALRRRLPSTPPADPEALRAPTEAAGAASTSWPLIAGVTVLVGGVVGALYWGLASRSDLTASQASPASSVSVHPVEAFSSSKAPTPTSSTFLAPTVQLESSVSEAPPTEPTAEAPVVEAPVEPRASGSQGTIGEETRSGSRLAEEVALLSRATSALHSGRAHDALRALAEHQRRFPRGSLSMERHAARAQALSSRSEVGGGTRTSATRALFAADRARAGIL